MPERLEPSGPAHRRSPNTADRIRDLEYVHCAVSGLLMGHIREVPGAQGSTLEELRANLREVLKMLSEEDAVTSSERE